MQDGVTPNRGWPTMSAELDPMENLVVWSYRSWAIAIQAGGEARWRLLRYEFRRQFGRRSGEGALERFSILMRQIGGHTRTPLKYHAPCCPCLGPQEVAVMSLVAACQARRWILARRIAACLVAHDGIGAVIAAAAGFADIMHRHLPALPLRLSSTGPNPFGEAQSPEPSAHDIAPPDAVPTGATIH